MTGKYEYQLVDGWGRGPSGREMGIVSGVAMDASGLVYMVDREPHPAIVVFDRNGNLVREWGHDLFTLPHDVWIDTAQRVYVTDVLQHVVRICTTTGELLQTLGTPSEPGAEGMPFNKPTRAVTAPDGEILVSDGYGQCYVHRFDRDGNHLQSWGGRGGGPGQFTLPHNVFVAPDDTVAVLDREPNNRACFFDRHGNFLRQHPTHDNPCGLHFDADGVMYVAEGDIYVHRPSGELLARVPVLGLEPGDPPPDPAHGAHSVWVDENGDLYGGEVGLPNLFFKYLRVD